MKTANADGEPAAKEFKKFLNSWSLKCGVSGGGELITAQRHILKE
jgi:hypothetical protein